MLSVLIIRIQRLENSTIQIAFQHQITDKENKLLYLKQVGHHYLYLFKLISSFHAETTYTTTAKQNRQ